MLLGSYRAPAEDDPAYSLAADRVPPAVAEVRRLPPVDIPDPPKPRELGPQRETLEEAWAIALSADRVLQSKQWGVSSAQYALQSAQAQRWPTAAIEGSYTVRSDEQSLRFTMPGVPLPFDSLPLTQNESFAFRGLVDLPLYTSGRIGAGIEAAGARLSSAALDVEEAKLDLRLRVAERYVMVLRAEREVEVAQCTVSSLESHYRDAELLYKHEQVPQNDLLAAQVALSDARQKEIQARNLLDICRAEYNRGLGRPLDAPVQLAELQPETRDDDLDGLTAQAIRERPVLAGLSMQAQALQAQAESVRAKNGPQVALRGEYAFEENRYRTPEGIAGAGVGMTWNLFDGGRYRHEAAALMHQAESTRRLLCDLQSRIALEVRRAGLDIRQTRQRLQVTPEAIQRAEENLRVARKRYVAGVGTSTEVLDAEMLRVQARRNRDHALCDAVLAELRLRHATAELRR